MVCYYWPADVIFPDWVIFATVVERDGVHAVAVALLDRAREPIFAIHEARLHAITDLEFCGGLRRGDLLARGPLPRRHCDDGCNLLVGIEAQWAIWDSSRSKGKKEAARSRKRMNEISVERSAKALRLMVEDLRNQISSLSEEIDANRQLVKVAGNRYEKSIIEFQQNRITPTLHFEARLTLDQSKLDLAKTVSQYLKARDLYDERTTFDNKSSWRR